MTPRDPFSWLTGLAMGVVLTAAIVLVLVTEGVL